MVYIRLQINSTCKYYFHGIPRCHITILCLIPLVTGLTLCLTKEGKTINVPFFNSVTIFLPLPSGSFFTTYGAIIFWTNVGLVLAFEKKKISFI